MQNAEREHRLRELATGEDHAKMEDNECLVILHFAFCIDAAYAA
jgi:hypothetical protein